jgi:hypothetical protein
MDKTMSTPNETILAPIGMPTIDPEKWLNPQTDPRLDCETWLMTTNSSGIGLTMCIDPIWDAKAAHEALAADVKTLLANQADSAAIRNIDARLDAIATMVSQAKERASLNGQAIERLNDNVNVLLRAKLAKPEPKKTWLQRMGWN